MNCIEIDDLILNLWSAFPYIFKLIRQGWSNEKNDLSIYHFEIMGILMKQNNISMSEIRHLLGIQKSNITPLVDKLVNDGLVERFIDLDDRRIVRISLTDKGKHFMLHGKEQAKQNLKQIFAKFNNENICNISHSFKEIHNLLSQAEKEN